MRSGIARDIALAARVAAEVRARVAPLFVRTVASCYDEDRISVTLPDGTVILNSKDGIQPDAGTWTRVLADQVLELVDRWWPHMDQRLPELATEAGPADSTWVYEVGERRAADVVEWAIPGCPEVVAGQEEWSSQLHQLKAALTKIRETIDPDPNVSELAQGLYWLLAKGERHLAFMLLTLERGAAAPA